MGDFVVGLSVMLLLLASLLFIITIFNKIFGITTIYEYERGLKYTKGEFVGILGHGRYFSFKPSTTIEKMDMRPNLMTISGQEILTVDAASVKISLIALYEIIDPVVAMNKSINYYDALYFNLQLQLREAIATMELNEILINRNQIGSRILEGAIEKAKELGIKLNSTDVKDITLVGEMKKVYGQVLQAKKEGEAKLERARGEAATLRSLSNSAKMLENNPALLQLRILHALGESSGHTIILNTSNTNDVGITPKKKGDAQ